LIAAQYEKVGLTGWQCTASYAVADQIPWADAIRPYHAVPGEQLIRGHS
jgi:hypothetical protein